MDKVTIQKLQEDVQKLQAQMKEFSDWMEMKKRQQITYPLDKNSKDLIIFAVNNP
jgi:predicted phage tail protein